MTARRAFLAVSAAVLGAWALHNGLLLGWEKQHLGQAREPLLVALRALVWLLPAIAYLPRFDPRPLPVALGVTLRGTRASGSIHLAVLVHLASNVLAVWAGGD